MGQVVGRSGLEPSACAVIRSDRFASSEQSPADGAALGARMGTDYELVNDRCGSDT